MSDRDRLCRIAHTAPGAAPMSPADAFAVTGGVGRMGSMPLAELAQVGSRLFGAVGGQLRMSGLSDFTDLIAAIQAAREVSGSSEQAVTRLEALARELTDAESRERIARELGVRVMDRGEFRPLRDLLREITRAAKRDPDALGRAFTSGESRVLFADLATERGVEKFESYLDVRLETARIEMEAMARLNAETAAAGIQRWKTALSEFAGDVASPVARWAGDNPLLATAGGAALAMGGIGTVRRIRTRRRGRSDGGEPGGPGLRTMTVTTMRVQTLIARGFRGGPGGRGPGKLRRGLGKAAASVTGAGAMLLPRLRDTVGRVLRRSPVFGGAVTGITGAIDTTRALASGDYRAAAQEGGGLAGGVGGAVAGAKIGALLGPWGAVAGAAIGGVGGEVLGDFLTDALLDRVRVGEHRGRDHVTRRRERQEILNSTEGIEADENLHHAIDQSVHVTINGSVYAEDRFLDDLADRVRDARWECSDIIDPPPELV